MRGLAFLGGGNPVIGKSINSPARSIEQIIAMNPRVSNGTYYILDNEGRTIAKNITRSGNNLNTLSYGTQNVLDGITTVFSATSNLSTIGSYGTKYLLNDGYDGVSPGLAGATFTADKTGELVSLQVICNASAIDSTSNNSKFREWRHAYIRNVDKDETRKFKRLHKLYRSGIGSEPILSNIFSGTILGVAYNPVLTATSNSSFFLSTYYFDNLPVEQGKQYSIQINDLIMFIKKNSSTSIDNAVSLPSTYVNYSIAYRSHSVSGQNREILPMRVYIRSIDPDQPTWDIYHAKTGSVGTGRGIDIFSDSTLSAGNSTELTAESKNMIKMGGNTSSRIITFDNIYLKQFDVISYNIFLRMNTSGTSTFRSESFENIDSSPSTEKIKLQYSSDNITYTTLQTIDMTYSDTVALSYAITYPGSNINDGYLRLYQESADTDKGDNWALVDFFDINRMGSASTASATTGIIAEIYDVTTNSGGVPTTLSHSSTISVDNINISPDDASWNGKSSLFEVRFRGYLKPFKLGKIYFAIKPDNGIRIWINGEQVLNHWTNESEITRTFTYNFKSYYPVPILVEYFNYIGSQECILKWGERSQVVRTINSKFFFPEAYSSAGMTRGLVYTTFFSGSFLSKGSSALYHHGNYTETIVDYYITSKILDQHFMESGIHNFDINTEYTPISGNGNSYGVSPATWGIEQSFWLIPFKTGTITFEVTYDNLCQVQFGDRIVYDGIFGAFANSSRYFTYTFSSVNPIPVNITFYEFSGYDSVFTIIWDILGDDNYTTIDSNYIYTQMTLTNSQVKALVDGLNTSTYQIEASSWDITDFSVGTLTTLSEPTDVELSHNIVGLNNGKWVLVYKSNVSGTYHAYFIIYNTDYTVFKSATQLSTYVTDSWRLTKIALIALSDKFVMAWEEKPSSNWQPFFCMYNNDGTIYKSRTQFHSVSGNRRVCKGTGWNDDYFSITVFDNDSYIQTFDPSGNTVANLTKFNESNDYNNWGSSIAPLANGRCVTVITLSKDVSDSELTAYIINRTNGSVEVTKTLYDYGNSANTAQWHNLETDVNGNYFVCVYTDPASSTIKMTKGTITWSGSTATGVTLETTHADLLASHPGNQHIPFITRLQNQYMGVVFRDDYGTDDSFKFNIKLQLIDTSDMSQVGSPVSVTNVNNIRYDFPRITSIGENLRNILILCNDYNSETFVMQQYTFPDSYLLPANHSTTGSESTSTQTGDFSFAPSLNFTPQRVTFSGYLRPYKTGPIRFGIFCDDAVTLTINNSTIISSFTIEQSATWKYGTYHFHTWELVPISLIYYRWGGPAICRLTWEVDGQYTGHIASNLTWNSDSSYTEPNGNTNNWSSYNQSSAIIGTPYLWRTP